MTDTACNIEVVNIDFGRSNTRDGMGIGLVEPKTAEAEIKLENLVPKTASFDQVSAREFLQENVFPKLEVSLSTVSIDKSKL